MSAGKVILYADDDVDDRTWIRDACQLLQSSVHFQFVESGKEVISYLDTEEILPALIVLDLNMPGMDGRQSLQYLKANPKYQHIPVAIVTTSANRMDKDVCARLGASLYLIKPSTYTGWQQVVQQLEEAIK